MLNELLIDGTRPAFSDDQDALKRELHDAQAAMV